MKPRVAITGTGRAGTSFLMNLLTSLGIDTGFPSTHCKWDKHSNSGMENHVQDPSTWDALPYVIKDPKLSTDIGTLCQSGFLFQHVFVLFRKLEDAIASRETKKVYWNDPNEHRAEGGWEKFLLRILGQLFYDLAMNDISCTVMVYPRLAEDPIYCYRRLGFLVKHVPYELFETKFLEITECTNTSPVLPSNVDKGGTN